MQFQFLLFLYVILLLFFSILGQNWLIIHDNKANKNITKEEFSEVLKRFPFVFVGEHHDHQFGHQAELSVLELFHKVHYGNMSTFIVALEMFERDVQPYLDLYIQGKLDEESFLKYSRPWPNYVQGYKPLVDFVKQQQSTFSSVSHLVLGSNVPRRYANFVSSKQENLLFSMPVQEKTYMAPKIYAPLDRYWEKFQELMRSHVPPQDLPFYYRSQCLKDDTMAYSIHQNYPQDGKGKVISFQGAFHSDDRLGLFQRVTLPGEKLLLKVLEYKELVNIQRYRNSSDYLLFAPDNSMA